MKKEQEQNHVPAAANSAAPAIIEPVYNGPQGLEAFGREDLVIPRWRIVQPTSKEGTQGHFFRNLDKNEFQSRKVAFVKFTKGRVMFEPGDLSSPPICGSSDRVTPSAWFESPMNSVCRGCPYQQWGVNQQTGKREKPQCGETYTLLGLDIDEDCAPFFFQGKSMAMNPFKRFLTDIAMKAKQKRADMCDFELVLSTVKTSNKKGVYFLPNFGPLTYLPERPYADLAAEYRHIDDAGFDDAPPEDVDATEAGEGLAF